MTLLYLNYHIICKYITFYLFNDVLHAKNTKLKEMEFKQCFKFYANTDFYYPILLAMKLKVLKKPTFTFVNDYD